MSFEVLARRRVGDATDPAYPVVADDLSVVLDPEDGIPAVLPVRGAWVTRPGREDRTVDVAETAMHLLLTDSRLILQPRTARDRGTLGTALRTLRGKAASRLSRAGLPLGAMVGQVRYPWIAEVGFSPKLNFLDTEELLLAYRDVAGPARLHLRLDDYTDSGEVARSIVDAAVEHLRQTWSSPPAEVDRALGELATDERPANPLPGTFTGYRMPVSWPVPALPVPGRMPPATRVPTALGPDLRPGALLLADDVDIPTPAGQADTYRGPTDWQLAVDTGEHLTVAGSGLLGRAPELAFDLPGVSRLLVVEDPDKSLSKTHMAFGVDADGPWVKDMYSTNGTVLELADGERVICIPGRRTRVPPGARIVAGKRTVTWSLVPRPVPRPGE